MQLEDLAQELSRKYSAATKGEKVLEIHLFGIKHAKALKSVSISSLLAKAGVNQSYGTEVQRHAPFGSGRGEIIQTCKSRRKSDGLQVIDNRRF